MRTLADPFVGVPDPGGCIHTSFRVTEEDHAVLVEVGEFLGSLFRKDLKERVAMGNGPKHLGRAERKRRMSKPTTGRWASAITRRVDDMWERGMENLRDLRDGDTARIRTIRQRMKAKPQENVPKKRRKKTASQEPVYETVDGVRRKKPTRSRRKGHKPYPTKQMKEKKNLRVQKLEARHAKTVQQLDEGRPSIVVGGKKLANRRHNLDAKPAMTSEEWSQAWKMARLFLTVDGDSGYSGGNQTIKVLPDDRAGAAPNHYKIVMRLPNKLVHLSNTASLVPTYEFDASVRWKNKRLVPVWKRRMQVRRSVGYMIKWVDGRWKIYCLWAEDSPTEDEVPTLEQLRGRKVLGVDFNADHFACVVLDEHGNAVGAPVNFSFELEGSTARRLGVLAAVTQEMLDYAEEHGCRVLVVENLGFQDSKQVGRERGGFGKKGKQYRKMLHNFPTAAFTSLLMPMVSNRDAFDGVIIVDPAYTTKWGKQHWVKPLNNSRRGDWSGHHAASYVIGRRGLGYGAKRRCGKVSPKRSIRRKQSHVAQSITARTSSMPSKEELIGTVACSKALPFANGKDEQALLNSSERCGSDEQSSTRK